MIKLEEWAEVRRLHRAEGVSIKEIARRLGLARNTVRTALRADAPPSRERGPRGSLVDKVEPQVRVLLVEHPRMPATVIAERIGWTHSLTILKDRVRQLRPLFAPPDPTDRIEYAPGELAQCDLWFPPVPIPVGASGARVLPVLAMTCGYSRVTDAVMIPFRLGRPDAAACSRPAVTSRPPNSKQPTTVTMPPSPRPASQRCRSPDTPASIQVGGSLSRTRASVSLNLGESPRLVVSTTLETTANPAVELVSSHSVSHSLTDGPLSSLSLRCYRDRRCGFSDAMRGSRQAAPVRPQWSHGSR